IHNNFLRACYFGNILVAEKPNNLSQNNPHQVAQYSIYLCKEGNTAKAIKIFGHVEKDARLGEDFLAFISEFGPDLESYKGKPLFLKFHGYSSGDATSVWYYYLVDRKGNNLLNNSWISIHRSRTNRKCALTGIFLNLPGEAVWKMPRNLQTSK
ncbi:MAG: hypothetical protein NT030_08730, partial [Candidatus Saganbacteria bacterium]|nr:hypothetical protein [Candidatus Saganbacteria bacterium]